MRAVTDAVTAGTPAFATTEDSKFDRDVRTAVQVALERFVDLVGTDEPALPPHVHEVFVALGAAEAREDHGPEALLTSLRTASRLMLRTAYESLARVRPVSTGELLDLSEATNAFVDELAAASTDGFALQLRELAGEDDRRRRELAELLLRGSAPESVVVAAAAGIGWRALDVVVPVLLPPDQARDARFRYGADGVVAERARDAVLLLRAGPRAARAQLTEALQGRGAVVGPALPWPQVPEALRLAELAGRLVAAGAVAGPEPTFADDHLVALALNGEPGALAVLSERRLAPFAGPAPRAAGEPAGHARGVAAALGLAGGGVGGAVRAPADRQLPGAAAAGAPGRRSRRPGRAVRAAARARRTPPGRPLIPKLRPPGTDDIGLMGWITPFQEAPTGFGPLGWRHGDVGAA